MKKSLLVVLRFMAFLAIGLILLWLAFRKTDFQRLADDLQFAGYEWVLFGLFFGVIAYISRARRWILLITPLGYKPSLKNSYHAVMTGYLANIALPRLGELTRCVALGKKEKIPVDQLFGTVLIERAVDLISLLFILVIVLFTSGDKIAELLNESIFLPLQNKVADTFGVTWILWAALALVGIVSLLFVIKYRQILRKNKFFRKFFEIGRGIINGLKSITNLERKGEFIFHTILIWVCYAMMTWVVVFALDSTSGVNIGESFFLLVVGGLAMSAPVQGGFGVYHYAISRALIILENISMEDGLAYAVLTHESQLIWIAIAGTISFFLIFKKRAPEER